MKIILTYICLIVLSGGYAFAETPTVGSIDRSQEMIREDKALRQRIEQGEKFFVKTIICKGCSKLSEEEIKDIAAPFQGHWMTKKDIRQIMDLLKVNGSYELKKDGTLEITTNEVTN